MATVLVGSRSTVFPATEVEACIRDALADQAVLRTRRLPTTGTSIAPQPWEPEIDSLVVVELICEIEELLGVQIPPTFSPRGGYDSAEACINDLVSEAKAAWDELKN
jgi:acyl carrier protein